MTQREEFEAWKKINNALGFGLCRNNTPGSELDGYQDAYTQGQWLAWQAAQPAQEKAAIKTLEHLGYTYHGAEYWKPPLGKRPAQPEGWKLVPVEPTPKMLAAVVTSMDEHLFGAEAEKQYREDWAAMLSAAPSTKEQTE